MRSGITCKVCGKGEIVSRVEYHQVWKPISWQEHFFGRLSFFERLVDHRSFFQKLFVRIKRPRSVHTTIRHHCNVCGVIYEFVPGEKLESPKEIGEMEQVTPYLWTRPTVQN